jgi:hypothetical protein
LFGAIRLDFDKITVPISPEFVETFNDIPQIGLGFQFAQRFVENVIERFTNWEELLTDDDNYKTILQTLFQQNFKVLPLYLELGQEVDGGYEMGVYLCIGLDTHGIDPMSAIRTPMTIEDIETHLQRNDGKIFMFCGKGKHKAKKRAEQFAAGQYLRILGLSK